MIVSTTKFIRTFAHLPAALSRSFGEARPAGPHIFTFSHFHISH